MPEVTGIVNDPIRERSYMVKVTGSNAAEIFVFNMRKKYNKSDILRLMSIPTIVTDEAKKGHYILADIKMQDVLCEDGNYLFSSHQRKVLQASNLVPL